MVNNVIREVLTNRFNSPHNDEEEARWIREATDWKKAEEQLKCVYHPFKEGTKNRWAKFDLRMCAKL